MTPPPPATSPTAPLGCAACQGSLHVSEYSKYKAIDSTSTSPCLDQKRGLLERAANPEGSKSPLEFDAYTLNHAAFVGMNEVAWTIEFEQELTRREVFVEKNSASANHFAFFKTKEKARKMADDAMISISGSQVLDLLNIAGRMRKRDKGQIQQNQFSNLRISGTGSP